MQLKHLCFPIFFIHKYLSSHIFWYISNWKSWIWSEYKIHIWCKQICIKHLIHTHTYIHTSMSCLSKWIINGIWCQLSTNFYTIIITGMSTPKSSAVWVTCKQSKQYTPWLWRKQLCTNTNKSFCPHQLKAGLWMHPPWWWTFQLFQKQATTIYGHL